MKFRYRLGLFLVAVLVGVQVLTGVSTYRGIRENLIAQGTKQLAIEAKELTRELGALSERVGNSVRVLALDYPLRQAIADNDKATVSSALINHGSRVGATGMFLIGLDGTLAVDTMRSANEGTRFPFAGLLDQARAQDLAKEFVVLDGKVFWIIVVPVNAPVPIGFLAAAVPVDDELLASLKRNSVLPISFALAVENGSAFAAVEGGKSHKMHLPPPGTPLRASVTVTDDDGDEYVTQIAPLPTARESRPVFAVLEYQLAEALRQYDGVLTPVLEWLAFGLVVALIGAGLIARGVSRPIEELASAARRIEAGDYALPRVLPQRDEVGQLSAAIAGMLHAISERQMALESAVAALEHARDEAVRANDAKSQFLANMSHEFRTPLNAIIGFSEIIQSQMLGAVGDARYLSYAHDIRESGRHLLSLIEDILDLAKVEAGKLHVERERVRPNEVLDAALAMIRPLAAKADVRIRVEGDCRAWPEILGDRVKLKQVLINLIGNAVKFTPAQGSVTISADVVPETLTIRIADTGIGIRAADIPLVCRPFHRASSAFEGKYQGAGLGLPIAKAFVEMHGGTLSIESRLGAGTTVSIVLPLPQAAAAPPPALACDAA
jgi:signal transduction histidine kinase